MFVFMTFKKKHFEIEIKIEIEKTKIWNESKFSHWFENYNSKNVYARFLINFSFVRVIASSRENISRVENRKFDDSNISKHI